MEAPFPTHDLSESRPPLGVGTGILVRNSFNLWSAGFQVNGWRDGAYEVRRCSDGAVLPRSFPMNDVRPA
jgi:hypothetical protein